MTIGELEKYFGGGNVAVRWGASVGVVGPCDFLT